MSGGKKEKGSMQWKKKVTYLQIFNEEVILKYFLTYTNLMLR